MFFTLTEMNLLRCNLCSIADTVFFFLNRHGGDISFIAPTPTLTQPTSQRRQSTTQQQTCNNTTQPATDTITTQQQHHQQHHAHTHHATYHIPQHGNQCSSDTLTRISSEGTSPLYFKWHVCTKVYVDSCIERASRQSTEGPRPTHSCTQG